MYPNKYKIEHITDALKAARKKKGLSQRELSRKSGVPQSHISRIENGAVDLRVSSLMEIARTLGMELIIVPRKMIPAVQSLAGGKFKKRDTTKSAQAHNLDEDDYD